MAKLITILLLFISTCAFSQFRQNDRTDVVRYDYSTYTGTPIKKGWLFDDETYKKLYVSYNAADSLMKAFEQYEQMLKKMDDLNKQISIGYENRIKDKDVLIVKQNKDIDDLNKLLKESNENVEKFSKQFIKIGKVRLHKGTAIKIGVSTLVVGYLIGKF